jgi:hypothetical protein
MWHRSGRKYSQHLQQVHANKAAAASLCTAVQQHVYSVGHSKQRQQRQCDVHSPTGDTASRSAQQAVVGEVATPNSSPNSSDERDGAEVPAGKKVDLLEMYCGNGNHTVALAGTLLRFTSLLLNFQW